MRANEVREKYLKFFESKGHKRIQPSPIIPINDPTTLFTSSGMQQLVPYLSGEPHPLGKRLVDSQPLLRAHGLKSDDTEEVGNNRHLTFFEMLGNWSLGDYFKKEQLSWIFEFLTKDLRLSKDKLWVSVFEGNKQIEKDTESTEIWKGLGISEDRIKYYDVKKNWWSRAGTPEEMPVGEIGGPTSEIFYEFDTIPHDKKYGEECHPNCDCGRFMEIGNSVFMVYIKTKNGLEELPNKNVDFGGGLERLTAATLNEPDAFRSDLFYPSIKKLEELSGKSYGKDPIDSRNMRIIADHMRSAVMLIASDIFPSNKQQGYVLRKFIRRMSLKMRGLKGDFSSQDFLSLINNVVDEFEGLYIEKGKKQEIVETFSEEVEKFKKSLDKGLKELEKMESVDAKAAFDLYQSYGFPLELTAEILSEKGKSVDKEEFGKEFEKHKESSKTASAGMFKGGLADHSEETTKLHTATHLLHESLRRVLGEHVSQKGSNITAERLRFDFSHPQKLTDEQLKKVEDMINEQVEKSLPVTMETKTFKEAGDEGALAFFGEKYGERVNVYTIGDPSASSGLAPFSREVCGGPHVGNTRDLGHVRIFKQEKVGSGIIRVYASVQNEHS